MTRRAITLRSARRSHLVTARRGRLVVTACGLALRIQGAGVGSVLDRPGVTWPQTRCHRCAKHEGGASEQRAPEASAEAEMTPERQMALEVA